MAVIQIQSTDISALIVAIIAQRLGHNVRSVNGPLVNNDPIRITAKTFQAICDALTEEEIPQLFAVPQPAPQQQGAPEQPLVAPIQKVDNGYQINSQDTVMLALRTKLRAENLQGVPADNDIKLPSISDPNARDKYIKDMQSLLEAAPVENNGLHEARETALKFLNANNKNFIDDAENLKLSDGIINKTFKELVNRNGEAIVTILHNHYSGTSGAEIKRVFSLIKVDSQFAGDNALRYYIAKIRSAYILYHDKQEKLVQILDNITDELALETAFSNESALSFRKLDASVLASELRTEIFTQYHQDAIANTQNKPLYNQLNEILGGDDNATKSAARFFYNQWMRELALEVALNGGVLTEEEFNRTRDKYIGKLGAQANLQNFVFADNQANILAHELPRIENQQALQALIDEFGIRNDRNAIKISTVPLTSIPTALIGLSNLQSLTINNSPQLQQIPYFVKHFSQLQTLDLSGNNINQVPVAISQMASLTTLNLSGNQNLAELPANLAGMTNLRNLDIFGTGINQVPLAALLTLPNALANAENSLALRLGQNQFNAFPGEWNNGVGLHPNVIGAITAAVVRPAVRRDNVLPQQPQQPQQQQRLELAPAGYGQNTYLTVLTAIGNANRNKEEIKRIFKEQIALIDLAELRELSKIMVKIQSENYKADTMQIQAADQNFTIPTANLVFLRNETGFWKVRDTHGITDSWQEMVQALKNRIKEPLLDARPEAAAQQGEIVNPDQDQAFLSLFKLQRSRIYNPTKTKTEEWYRQNVVDERNQVIRKPGV